MASVDIEQLHYHCVWVCFRSPAPVKLYVKVGHVGMVKTESLVLAGQCNGHCPQQYGSKFHNVHKTSHLLVPPFLSPRPPMNHTSDISAFVGPIHLLIWVEPHT